MPTPLGQLHIGQQARITQVGGQNPLRQRFLDMGLVRGTLIQVVNQAPLGDPLELNVRGYNLALRRREADLIQVELVETPPPPAAPPPARRYEFGLPGLRLRAARPAAARRQPAAALAQPRATILLAGNPNCGKSTSSTLTSTSMLATGRADDWAKGPVAVACRLPGGYLPSAYSLAAYSLGRSSPGMPSCRPADLVVIVADAANLERNLYLVVQILEMGVRAVLALNMWDVAQSEGISIDRHKLAARLGIPVVPTALNQGGGLEELKQAILQALDGLPPDRPRPICAAPAPVVINP
jgi:ferrous iron transport protein B